MRASAQISLPLSLTLSIPKAGLPYARTDWKLFFTYYTRLVVASETLISNPQSQDTP
jgi:hypothetical protein